MSHANSGRPQQTGYPPKHNPLSYSDNPFSYIKQIDGKPYLFSYFEYVGNNFNADMQKMAADPNTQKWWKRTDPTQIPLPDAAAKGKILSDMQEVFHTE
ncbi:L-rhamnose mutarotase [Mucilaginibacter sp. UYNi724]